MDDLISRKTVIKMLQLNRDEEMKKSCSAESAHKSVIRARHDSHVAFCDYLIQHVEDLPSIELYKAKKPKYKAVDRFIDNHFFMVAYCPRCDAEVDTGQCYCMMCGQHIDWSEDDE